MKLFEKKWQLGGKKVSFRILDFFFKIQVIKNSKKMASKSPFEDRVFFMSQHLLPYFLFAQGVRKSKAIIKYELI